jgi:hypothetical protein
MSDPPPSLPATQFIAPEGQDPSVTVATRDGARSKPIEHLAQAAACGHIGL